VPSEIWWLVDLKILMPADYALFWKHESLAVGVWSRFLFLVLTLCVAEFNRASFIKVWVFIRFWNPVICNIKVFIKYRTISTGPAGLRTLAYERSPIGILVAQDLEQETRPFKSCFASKRQLYIGTCLDVESAVRKLLLQSTSIPFSERQLGWQMAERGYQ